MDRVVVRPCPVCKKETAESDYYAVGFHVSVCSRECQIKAYERLRAQEQLVSLELESEYAGPDA